MNNIKYVGMGVHKSITVIVVLNELGQFEIRSQIKTKGENICDFFRGISGKVEVVFEEGTHSAWLYILGSVSNKPGARHSISLFDQK